MVKDKVKGSVGSENVEDGNTLFNRFKSLFTKGGSGDVSLRDMVDDVEGKDLVKERDGALVLPEKSITERLNDLESKVLSDEDRGVKKFNLPFGLRVGGKSAAKRKMVLGFVVRKNRVVDGKLYPVVNGMILVDGVLRNFDEASVFLWRGRVPCVILPEWSLSPYCPGGTDWVTPTKIMIRNLERPEDIGVGRKLGGKAWLIVGVLVIVAGYVLFSGSGGG